MPSRDLGLSHGAGKGDSDRTASPKAFRERLADVTFPALTDEKKGFTRRGRRLVKTYGTPDPLTLR